LMRYKGLTPWDDLKHIMECEGLGKFLWVLEEVGVCSWARLGAMSEDRWQRLMGSAPTKSPEVPGDLSDTSKLGPGHEQILDDMRRCAYYDMFVWNALKRTRPRCPVTRSAMTAYWRHSARARLAQALALRTYCETVFARSATDLRCPSSLS
jgi:hypothetical protein